MESGEETICLTFSKGTYRQDVRVALIGTERLPDCTITPKRRVGTAMKKRNLGKGPFFLVFR